MTEPNPQEIQDICDELRHAAENRDRNNRQARIDAWNAMTVDERLNDIRRRIEQLERGPAVYGGPRT